jgi:hypothetical protein
MIPSDEIERVIPSQAWGEPAVPKADDDTVRGAVGERLRTERLRLERECELLRAKLMRLQSSGAQVRSRPSRASSSRLSDSPRSP